MNRALAIVLALSACAMPLQLARGKCPGLTSHRIDAGTALAVMVTGVLLSSGAIQPFNDGLSNYKAGGMLVFGALGTLMIDMELENEKGCR